MFLEMENSIEDANEFIDLNWLPWRPAWRLFFYRVKLYAIHTFSWCLRSNKLFPYLHFFSLRAILAFLSLPLSLCLILPPLDRKSPFFSYPLSPPVQSHPYQSHPQIFFALRQKLCKRLCFDKRKLGLKNAQRYSTENDIIFVCTTKHAHFFCCYVLCDCRTRPNSALWNIFVQCAIC